MPETVSACAVTDIGGVGEAEVLLVALKGEPTPEDGIVIGLAGMAANGFYLIAAVDDDLEVHFVG